jgi:hypothetical protein
LFVADWYWPAAPATTASDDQAQETSLDKQILRIQSAQKWPQKIVFDTSIPTIVPPPVLVANAPLPPPPLAAAAALNKSALDAHAEVKPAAQPQTPVRKMAAARHRAYRPAPPRIDAYPVASAWSPWW